MTRSEVTLSPPVQIALSTAEDAANYFTGEESCQVPAVSDLSRVMPSGIYRIVDDQLFHLSDLRSWPRKETTE